MRKKKISKHGATVVNEATQSLANFSNENQQTEMFMFFIVIGDEHISGNKEQAKKTLIEIYEDPTNEVSVELVNFFKTEKADELFDMMFYERHFSQMAFSRSIDNFITYFKEILAEVVIKKPQILKSKDQERLDFILEHKTMEDLLRSISEKKIEDLFYKGINDIGKFFEDRLGIKIFKNEDESKTISRLIKQRNLIVHNRGKISKDYVQEYPDDGFEAGLYFVFEYEKISHINLYLSNFLIELDSEISDKFDLDLIKT